MIKDKIIEQLKRALETVGIQEEKIDLDHPTNEQFGDYATSIALKAAKSLKKNPMEVAEDIVKNFPKDDLIEKVEVVKPGFINIYLSQKILLSEIKEIINQADSYGKTNLLKDQKVMIEYTDPNPFKEFHIGHLYSNIVGESLARLHETLGADVKRANYQGDVGMHVAKAIWGIKKRMTDEKLNLADLSSKPLEERTKFMGAAYALGATAFEENEQAKEEIRKLNKVIYELSDPNINELYKIGRQWSLEHFDEIYARLGTKFDYFFFEREVGEKGVKLVNENLDKGIFKKSDGAVIFEGDKHGLHTRVFINSLGLPTYEAKDLALPSIKYEKFPYDLSIIVTGNEINEYFHVILKALEFVNPELRAKIKHLSHGMVRLPEGKMSSRTGKILTGEWLLDEAYKKALEKIQETTQTKSSEQESTAEIVGTGAIKYALLKNNIGKNIEFNFDESISFEGNAGPYLQYSYVRCVSLMKKSGAEIEISELKENIHLEKEELEILRQLQKFSDMIVTSGRNYSPNTLSNYLYNLAQKFNLFYQKHQILKADGETKNFRLLLTKATAQIIKNGLYLLGIETVEKM